jgi:predicted MPP superfamily phosphohydrolase
LAFLGRFQFVCGFKRGFHPAGSHQMAHGIYELLWSKILLKDLEYDCKEPMSLYCDNKAAINITHNPVQHDQTKHIEIDRHLSRKNCVGLIWTPYLKTE